MAGLETARRLVAAAVALALSVACAAPTRLGGLRVRPLATSADPPANVAIYVGVTDQGEPLTDLDAASFRIYENGRLLSPARIKTTLLPRELVTSEHVVLLVDLSGDVSKEDRAIYAQAVEAFVRKLQTTLPVTVLAYSGSETPRKVGEYGRASNALDATPPNADSLENLATPDSSRDLYGAVLAGLEELDARLEAEGKPVALGTLVVFSRGPDLAGRVSEDDLAEELLESEAGIIGIGVEEETPYLDFALNGVFRAGDPEEIPNAVPIAFEEAASKIMKVYRRYYLLAYCSPSRAGRPKARLEVVYRGEGGSERYGEADFEFDADGFTSGCNPEATPSFRAR